MLKEYVVFIPKYEFELENGKAIKRCSDSSLTVTVRASSSQEATIQVLKDLGHAQLDSAGYCVYDIQVQEAIPGQDMRVFIKGVDKI